MAVKPMLASPAERDQICFPCVASPKVDGIRVMNWNGKANTRSMKPVPNRFVQNYISCDALKGLDGECVVGEPNDPDIFNKTTGVLRRHDGEPDFTWWVFDDRWAETDKRGFDERYGGLKKLFELGTFEDYPRVKLLPHQWISNESELEAFEVECAKDGWEGVMVRSPKGPYKNGRSTLREGFLLKRKLWADAECEVLGCYELMINENEAFINETGNTKRSTNAENLVAGGTLGGFYVKELDTGIEFKLGAGGTHEERQKVWDTRDAYVGKIITFKHMPYGRKDAPRQPIFKGFREKFDMDAF